MRNQQGYIALITILIISALVLLLGISANLLAISESDMGLGKNQASGAYYLANTCAEEALQQIRDSVPFEGSGNLSVGNGICSYTVTRLVAQERTIIASGTVGTITRRLSIALDKINPDINITSWQEVADF